MKKLMTTILVLMIACVFAAVAFAQDGDMKQQKLQKQEAKQLAQNAHGNTEMNNNQHSHEGEGEPPYGGASGEGSGDAAGGSGEKVFTDDDMDGINDESLSREYGKNRSADATLDGELENERRQMGAEGDSGPHSEEWTDGDEGFGEPADPDQRTEDAEIVRNRGKRTK